MEGLSFENSCVKMGSLLLSNTKLTKNIIQQVLHIGIADYLTEVAERRANVHSDKVARDAGFYAGKRTG